MRVAPPVLDGHDGPGAGRPGKGDRRQPDGAHPLHHHAVSELHPGAVHGGEPGEEPAASPMRSSTESASGNTTVWTPARSRMLSPPPPRSPSSAE